jgi:outer membrane protein, multidrug efflux system
VTRGAAIAGLALALGGCLLGPDYARPPVPVPERWQEPVDDAGSLADRGWWEFFEDPVLVDLVRNAREQSTDVRVAAARVEQARAELVVAGAARFPQLDASGSYANTRLSEVTFPATITLPGTPPTFQFKPEGQIYRTTLDLSFELDLWGRLRRATEAARAELLATDAARRTVFLTLVSDVATFYFNLLERDEELAVSRRTVETRRESLRILRLRFREGVSPELDVRRAEGELAAATNIVPDLERQIRQIENALSVLLGRNPGPIPRGRPLTAYTVPLEVPAGLPSVLLERRPDVRQAEHELVAANARIGQAKAAFFPRITLTGSYGVESRELAMLFTGPAQVWSFGPSITAPIFNAGRIGAGVDFAEAQRDEALAQYRRVIQTAFREVEDALIAHRKNREEVVEDHKQVTAYREVVRLARLRYFSGIGTQFEVLDAERQLLAAELATVRTTGDQLVALVQLYKALGGGWTSEP